MAMKHHNLQSLGHSDGCTFTFFRCRKHQVILSLLQAKIDSQIIAANGYNIRQDFFMIIKPTGPRPLMIEYLGLIFRRL